jgi:L-serine/L-threonine ammonia-lyase
METIGANSLNESLVARNLVTLEAITSIATALGALQVAPELFERVQVG